MGIWKLLEAEALTDHRPEFTVSPGLEQGPREGTQQRDLIEKTALAVERFREGKFEEARAAWEALQEAHGESPLAKLYLDEFGARRVADPAFDGVLHLASK